MAIPSFAISGWAVDLSSVSTTGIDAVAVYTGSMSAPVLLGYATFEPRPDVAAYFQRPGYANAGYRFTVAPLPAGNQQLGVMVHSTVTNTWYGPYVRNVVIPAAPTVTIDAVTSATQPIVLRGVAGDLASVSGPGISSVEIWADPTSGAPSILVGAATLGFYRPDAAVYGYQYLYSGWERVVRGLPPAAYTFRARGLSSVTGLAGQGLSAPVSVVNDPRIYVQAPANNVLVTAPFSVVGAVADLAAASGTGMSAVHIYVRPVGSATLYYAGQAVPNLPRPDLQSYVGNNSQFLNIGFQVDNLPVPSGAYDLLTYAYSLVSNAWTVVITRITVVVPAAAPVLTPPNGQYSTPIAVSGTSSTPGAVLRFTLDGTDPTEASPVLPPSVVVAAPGSGKVRAFAPSYLPSPTVTATYTFLVGTPTVTPAPGPYEGPVQFSASTVSPGAVIRFTTNGTDPTEASPELGATLTLHSSVSAKLRAYRQGWQPSAVTTATYTITPARPTFTVATGTYTNVQSVAMQTSTLNGVIRYAANGTDPTSTSTVYATPLSPSIATTYRARTFDALGASSPVSTVSITYAVGPASLQPPPAEYSAPVSVRLASDTTNAVMRYTLDGSTPTSASPTLSNGTSLLVSTSSTLRVQPYVAGWPSAAVVGGLYTLRAPAPTVTPETGTYARPFSVSVSPPPSGGVIRYTLDGTTPSESSLMWTSFSNPGNGTYLLTLRAFVPGWTASDPVARTYAIVDSVAPTPTMTPPPGDHAIGVSVAISTTDPGATIRVTTDGSAPTATSLLYAGPITLSTPTTVRARAFKALSAPSNIGGGLYRLKLQTPAVTPPAGTYSSAPALAATHPASGVTLRYTTDRREPTDSSLVVPASCCIPVTDGTTVKVRAFLQNWAPSDTATNTYFLSTVVVPVSGSVFSSSPADGAVVATGSPLSMFIAGTPLVPATVRVTRNGVDVTNLFTVAPTSISASGVVLAGTTVVGVSAVDVSGASAGTSLLVVGTPSTFTVTVRNQSGAALAGAFVTLTDSIGNVPAQYATTGIDGTAVMRAGTGFSGELTVQHTDHHSYFAAVSGSAAIAVLNERTENFERGVSEWSRSYPQQSFIRTHIEGISPWICVLNCPATPLFASDTADNDMIIGTFQSPVPVTASRTFRFEPGSRVANVRYRFFSHVPSGWFRLTATVPSTGQVVAEHVSTMANLQGAGQAYPGTQNLQSIWLTMAVPLPTSTPDLRITISLPADTNPANTATWIEVDRTQLQGVQLGAPDLRDVHEPNTTTVDPLRFISLGQRDAGSGMTEIWGKLSFSGTPDRSVSSVFLDVKNFSDKVLRVSVALDPTITGLLNVAFPATGLLTTGAASRRLFQFTDPNMQAFTVADEEKLLLSIRAFDNIGAPIVVAGDNQRTVVKLADIRPGVARYSGRDPLQCTGTTTPWPCRGDAWGRPKVQAALLAAYDALVALPQNPITLLANDISNINGGFFPPHGTHRNGDAADLDVAGYDNMDAVLVKKLVRICQALLTASVDQAIVFRRILVGYPSGGAFEEELLKPEHVINGQPASAYIKQDTSPKGHRDHFHADFTVP